MNSKNPVSKLLYAQKINMGGLMVRQPFPTQQIEQIDPFLLLHHANTKFNPDGNPEKQGVGPHPHRGFSPVTFVYHGGIRHRDSRENDSTIYAGGTQWMNAGRGIIHSERPASDISAHGNRIEIIQLWINNPARHKMDQPEYQTITKEETPLKELDQGKVLVQVVAGSYQNLKGPINTLFPLQALRISGKKSGKLILTLPPQENSFLYLLNGKIRITGFGIIEAFNAVIPEPEADQFEIEILEAANLLFLSAPPLNEPLAIHGPFVMNDQTGILKAFRDYQMGKMGVLIE